MEEFSFSVEESSLMYQNWQRGSKVMLGGWGLSVFNEEFVICNTKSIMFNTESIMFNTESIMFNARFIMFNHRPVAGEHVGLRHPMFSIQNPTFSIRNRTFSIFIISPQQYLRAHLRRPSQSPLCVTASQSQIEIVRKKVERRPKVNE